MSHSTHFRKSFVSKSKKNTACKLQTYRGVSILFYCFLYLLPLSGRYAKHFLVRPIKGRLAVKPAFKGKVNNRGILSALPIQFLKTVDADSVQIPAEALAHVVVEHLRAIFLGIAQRFGYFLDRNFLSVIFFKVVENAQNNRLVTALLPCLRTVDRFNHQK